MLQEKNQVFNSLKIELIQDMNELELMKATIVKMKKTFPLKIEKK